MKITCDNCGAKYSIADEKVRGKVFKIRCKKCSHIVVVRGASTASSEPAQSGGEDDPGDEHVTEAAGSSQGAQPEAAQDAPTWHIVVGREQVGPVTLEDIRDRLSRGEISGDSYVWRDGYADWMRISAVRDFADALQPEKTVATTTSPVASAQAEMDPEPTPTIATNEDPLDAPSEPAAAGYGLAAGVGLFGGGTEAEVSSSEPASGGGVAADDPASAGLFGGVAADAGHQRLFGDEDEDDGDDLAHPQMTGQRGENSVLFSLANLQALAMSDSAAAPAPTSSASAGGDDGGSGLIDIRAMAANATGTGRPAVGAEPDLPVIGGLGGGMAVAPVLMPAGGTERPKWLIPVVLGLAAVLLIAVGLLTMLLIRSPSTESVDEPAGKSPGMVAATTAPQGGAGAAKPVENAAASANEAKAAGAAASGTATEASGATASGAAAEPAGKTPETSRKSARKRSSRRKRSATRAAGAQRASSAEASQPRRRRTRKKAPRDELDRMIDGALSPSNRRTRRSAASPAAAVDKNLPEQLSRSQIVGGMRSVKAGVQRCYDRFKVPGLANVKLKIGNNGRVKGAEVKGRFAGTPTGACVKRAVTRARFPKFKTSSMSITYPFMLR